jgi:hypothetical protein
MVTTQPHCPSDSNTSTPTCPEPLDLELVNAALDAKSDRQWSINSRESTPYIEAPPCSQLQYWRNRAIAHAKLIELVRPHQTCRMSIDSAAYWEIEARHLMAEYWKTTRTDQPREQPGKGRTGQDLKSGVRKASRLGEGPISSRLRSSRNNSSATTRRTGAPRKRPKR